MQLIYSAKAQASMPSIRQLNSISPTPGQLVSTHIIRCLACLVLLAWGSQSSLAARPNIVFLLADDLRYDAIGANGNPIIKTPNIDQLANSGVSFNQAFVTTSICAISRASILTGQHACRHRIHGFGSQLSSRQLEDSYVGRLKSAGYQVGFVGKWGVASTPSDLFHFNAAYEGQGSYYGYPTTPQKHLTQHLEDTATEFIHQQQPGQPFCLSVSFKAPHVDDGNAKTPFNYDQRLASLYEDVTIPPASLSTPEFFESLPKFLQTSENRIRWQNRFATEELYQRSVKGYYRLVSGIDRAVGEILQQLGDQGFLENTVVIFASDHGFYLGERGFAGKWYPHDLSIQIPLIIKDYRSTNSHRTRTIDAIALNIDLAPTMLDYADVEAPEQMQGQSLKALADGENPASWRDDFYYDHPFRYATIPRSEGLRNSQFKYIIYPESDEQYEELYDLENDPQESKNLAQTPAYHSELQKLRKRLQVVRQQACAERVAISP